MRERLESRDNIGDVTVDLDPWIDIAMAATRLAQLYDGADRVTEVRRRQWKRRIWVWVHRARLAGDQLPSTQVRGRKVYYRLSELEEFAARHVNVA